MTSQICNPEQSSFQPPLRAMIEITADSELKIFPIADSDAAEKQILDALRLAQGRNEEPRR